MQRSLPAFKGGCQPGNFSATKPDRSICCQHPAARSVQDRFTPSDSRPSLDGHRSSRERRILGTRAPSPGPSPLRPDRTGFTRAHQLRSVKRSGRSGRPFASGWFPDASGLGGRPAPCYLPARYVIDGAAAPPGRTCRSAQPSPRPSRPPSPAPATGRRTGQAPTSTPRPTRAAPSEPTSENAGGKKRCTWPGTAPRFGSGTARGRWPRRARGIPSTGGR